MLRRDCIRVFPCIKQLGVESSIPELLERAGREPIELSDDETQYLMTLLGFGDGDHLEYFTAVHNVIRRGTWKEYRNPIAHVRAETLRAVKADPELQRPEGLPIPRGFEGTYEEYIDTAFSVEYDDLPARGPLQTHWRDPIENYGSVNTKFLLKRGWTRTAIRKILGEPDRRIPMLQRPDRPECRYDVQRVLAAEASGAVRLRDRSKDDLYPIEDPDLINRFLDKLDELNEIHRLRVAVPQPDEPRCAHCKNPLTDEPRATGRPRKYCSTRCRNAAARSSKANRADAKLMR